MALLTMWGGGGVPGETSEVFSDASKIPALGTRCRDHQGNEYVLVDFGASQPTTGFQGGEFVSFDHNYLATRITTTSRGWVGVIMAARGVTGTITTTNRYGWVQVYGINTFAWGSSDITSLTMLFVPATTDLGYLGSALVATTVMLAIYGVIARTAPDTCASTALSTSALAAPFTVQLNYPFVTGNLMDHGAS